MHLKLHENGKELAEFVKKSPWRLSLDLEIKHCMISCCGKFRSYDSMCHLIWWYCNSSGNQWNRPLVYIHYSPVITLPVRKASLGHFLIIHSFILCSFSVLGATADSVVCAVITDFPIITHVPLMDHCCSVISNLFSDWLLLQPLMPGCCPSYTYLNWCMALLYR